MNYTDHTHQEQVPSLLLLFFFSIIASKGQKILMYGLTNWSVDPWEAAQKTPSPGEAFSMGTSPPELHTLIPGGVSYNAAISGPVDTPTSTVTRCLSSGSLQIKWSLYFCECEKSLLRVSFYSSYRVDSFVPYRPSRDILIAYCVL